MPVTLSITVQDTQAQRIASAICGLTHYQETIPDPAFVPESPEDQAPLIPNPISKQEWVRRWLAGVLRRTVNEWERQQAASAVVDDIDVS